MSEAATELEPHDSETTSATAAYAPYAQLIKMLLPRSTGVAIYDHGGELTWCSEGYEKPEYRELINRNRPAFNESLELGAIHETSSGQSAFLVNLKNAHRAVGSVIVELGPTRQAWNETVVKGLLKPVLRCLENCMELERSIEHSHNDDHAALDLLLGVDEDDPSGPSPLHRLVRHCVEHLECSVGALVITDKSMVVTHSVKGGDGKVSHELLSRTQKNLLAWAQLNNRTMLVNHVGRSNDLPSYKILSCPVHAVDGSVAGVLALFRAHEQPDFDLKDVRILEYIARRAIGILDSRHDALTGLANKYIFERRVQTALNRGANDDHSLLYIDIDRLQSINEAFGYQAGDEVIKRLAEAIQQQLRPVDMASRLGGDRIAVYLHGQSVDAARTMADGLTKRMAGLSYLRDQKSLSATLSVGLVQPKGAGQVLGHVLAAAEIACKRAKLSGGNCVVAAAGGQAVRQVPQSFHESVMLQHALANNEFRLQAQPIVGLALSTGETLGHEILLRLRDAQGQLIAPEKFLDIAHRYDLMTAIDRWVVASIAQAMKDTAGEAEGVAQQITINVSSDSLKSGDYVDFALNEFERAGCSPQLFHFEIKESVAVENLALAGKFIRTLRASGCQVGLDDFGVRMSSFADLKELPVQYLKIDGSIVRRIEEDKYAESVVQGIAKAAEILGMFTIAEHVETPEIAARLRDLEISFGQGFHFGKPRPIESIFRGELADI
jgi:diguanylate cyclase (GGDEF)-like protein